MMRAKSVVLGGNGFTCPVTNRPCRITSATVRLCPQPLEQMPLVDTDMTRYAAMNDDQIDAVNRKVAEADRDG